MGEIRQGASSTSTSVYEGVRILDFTQLEQGPSGTQVLADFGAEVIKIERIDVGEIGRDNTPRIQGMSPHWAANNRNKLSLSLNVKDTSSREILDRLIRSADVVASSFRPGVMERLGLSHEEVQRINPRIISAYASGYGQTGPYRHRRGQDLAAQAIGGVLGLTGTEEMPASIGTFAIDYLGAMHFAQGIMLALAARERTGRGQIVDSCLLNSAIALHLQEATTYLNTGQLYPRAPRGVAHSLSTALYAQYRTCDSRWIVIVAEYFIDQPWKRTCEALDLPQAVRDDPRFGSIEGLAENVEETYQLIQAALSHMTRDEAVKRLEDQDIIVAPVNEYPEVFSDAQVVHNEMIIETHHEAVGPIKLVGMPVKLSDTPGRLRLAPPTVGQDNVDILSALGFLSSEIAGFQLAGVVGHETERAREGGAASW